MRTRMLSVCLAALTCAAPVLPQSKGKSDSDVLFRAMKDEMERTRQLSLVNLDKPYYVEYSVDENEAFDVSASLGGLLDMRRNRLRAPHVQVRVGDYAFDNTDYVYADFFTPRNLPQLPWESNYAVLRHIFWLDTDQAYKGAVQAIGRKRAALQNLSGADKTPDFSKAEPIQTVLANRAGPVDSAKWTAAAKELSAQFAKYPSVLESSVEVMMSTGAYSMMNSEGSQFRIPDNIYMVRIRAFGRAKDGMPLRDSLTLQANLPEDLPQMAELKKLTETVANGVTALTQAPVGESYSGPVLFEGAAAGQLIAQLVGSNLTLNRKPVTEPGRPVPVTSSEFETKLGAKVMPEWMTVVDDPRETKVDGKPLLGSYSIDYEGVVPKPVTVVEKGRFKGFLLTRQPVKEFAQSNGRARMPGSFGARAAVFSNLIVEASESKPDAELKKQLLDTVKQRGLAYGLIVRKLDFPSTASLDEIRQIATEISQNGGSAKPVSIPLLVYRVYPDGREELVRGLRFRGLNAKALRDIVAASKERYVFDFQNNLAPFALVGAGNYVSNCAVVSPSLLFEEIDLEKQQDELPKPPLVPPPALTASR